MATFQSKNTVLTKKLDGVIYEMMVKTTSDMVYVDDLTTLTEKLYDIAELFTEYGDKQDKLQKEYSRLVEGSDKNYSTFKEIWDYININGEPKSELIKLIESKQDSEEGKGLSTHDLTDVLYAKLTNDYTKEELTEQFKIVIDTHNKFVNVVNKNFELIDGRVRIIEDKLEEMKSTISEVKSDVEEGKSAPNVIVSDSPELVEDISDYSCWYHVISKDTE